MAPEDKPPPPVLPACDHDSNVSEAMPLLDLQARRKRKYRRFFGECRCFQALLFEFAINGGYVDGASQSLSPSFVLDCDLHLDFDTLRRATARLLYFRSTGLRGTEMSGGWDRCKQRASQQPAPSPRMQHARPSTPTTAQRRKTTGTQWRARTLMLRIFTLALSVFAAAAIAIMNLSFTFVSNSSFEYSSFSVIVTTCFGFSIFGVSCVGGAGGGAGVAVNGEVVSITGTVVLPPAVAPTVAVAFRRRRPARRIRSASRRGLSLLSRERSGCPSALSCRGRAATLAASVTGAIEMAMTATATATAAAAHQCPRAGCMLRPDMLCVRMRRRVQIRSDESKSAHVSHWMRHTVRGVILVRSVLQILGSGTRVSTVQQYNSTPYFSLLRDMLAGRSFKGKE